MNARLPARRTASILAVLCIVSGCSMSPASLSETSAPPGATDSSAAFLVAIGAGLSGPSGMTASVYATGLTNASAFAFDPEGRLWVATAGYSDEGTDGVYIVSSSGATPRKIIDGVSTPLGLLWHDGSLYVSSAEGVAAYTGFNGSTFAGRRTVVTFAPGTGELNGIALGPDGRIALGISAPCDACDPTAEWSASVVSFLPDASDLRVEASGIRAPVGLAYYPGTSDLFVTMNQRDDLGARTPGDWLAVVRQGQAWGFPACYGQGGAACAGAPQPTAVLDRHAAVSGVAIVTGQLGPAVGTSALVAEWAKGKVQRVALEKTGSTYTGSVAPFLAGIKSPVPVLLGASGALLGGDWATGTVYSISRK